MKISGDILTRRRVEYGVVLVFFLAIMVLFTWPLVLHLHDGVTNNSSDTLCNTWIISWNARTLPTHPSGLFQANSFYPSRDVLAYSEILIPPSILAIPILYATRNPVLSYNILLLLGMVFSAFFCYLLVREITGSRWGALAAGIFYAFCPYKMSLIGELHLLFAPFLPLMILYFYRFMKSGNRKYLIMFGLFFLLQSLSSWHYLIFCTLTLFFLWIWKAAFSRTRQGWLRLAGVLIVSLVAFALILPFAAPYFRAHSRLPDFERSLEEAELFSAVPGDYIRVIPESLVYGSKPPPFLEYTPVITAVLYPGLMVLLLAAAGFFLRRRDGNGPFGSEPDSYEGEFVFFFLLAVFGIILTFGPRIGGIYNPFYMVPYNLGLLKFMRFPTRFFLLVSLALAVLAGYGTRNFITWVSRRSRRVDYGRFAAAGIVILLLLELATFNLVVHPVPVWGEVPEVYSWLGEQGDIKIIDLPATSLGPGSLRYDDWNIGFMPAQADYTTREALSQYYSIYHRKDLVNGYSGYLPYFYRRIYTEMQSFPSPRSVDLLMALDIDFVVWHWDWVDEKDEMAYNNLLAAVPGLALERKSGDESLYRIEKRGTASPEELRLTLAAPLDVPANEGFNLALMVTNAGNGPLAMACEDSQPCTLRFTDKAGNTVYEEKTHFRIPLFLAAGEQTSIPVKASSCPSEGDYDIELLLGGDFIGDQRLTRGITVRAGSDLVGSAVLGGWLRGAGEDAGIRTISAGGTLPLLPEVYNNGAALWRSRWEEEEVGSGIPYGLVYINALWLQHGEAVWEEQAALLPCDISPGQLSGAPILLRAPPAPGRYQLSLILRDKDIGWFGDALVLEFEVRRDQGAEQGE